MMQVFVELVKMVGIFIIIGQTILHFGIGKDYEKYMKLVVSFMVAAQIVFAFGAYFEKSGESVWKWEEEEYYENWDRNMKALEEEFEKKHAQVNMKLQQRFEEQGTMAPEQGEKSQRKIEIERITIQE